MRGAVGAELTFGGSKHINRPNRPEVSSCMVWPWLCHSDSDCRLISSAWVTIYT